MPYSSTDDLPAYVKKLPKAKQQQWMSVFNTCMADGGDDAKCFRMANGVAKKEIDDFEFEGEAEPPDSEEVKTAIKNYYAVDYETGALTEVEEPEFVVGEAMLYSRTSNELAKPGLISRLASMFSGKEATPEKAVTVPTGFAVVKQSDGKLRWFARYSNAWEDRDHEILTEAAHKDYIQWAYDTGTFPELWLWHTGGTRFGEADWLDFSNGFAHASGLIDNGKESVVASLSTKDVGVSHGFLSLQQGKYVSRYRTYEISVLPRERAAVETSGFNILDASKESEVMAFTEERRKFLIEAIGEEAVGKLEKSTDSMAQQLKELGVEYKASEEKKEADAEAQTEGYKALAEQVATLTEVVGQLAGVVGEQKKAIGEVQKTDDEKIEDAFLARVAKAFGQNGGITRPTESTQNVTATKEAAPQQGVDFLTQMLNEQLGVAAKSTNTVGTPAMGAVTVNSDDGVQEVRD